ARTKETARKSTGGK
nr:Chain B, H3Q5ser peptide [Homo sapiens]7CFQ_B Chain B, H3K4me3Q5ser peptide [Homo sapiens]